MATLYVQGVPDELYEALRGQAHQHRKSIAAEVLSLLEQNVPTARKLKSRRALLRRGQRLRSRKTRRGAFPSTDEMHREDRSR